MIYVRDGELRVVNDAKGQEGFRRKEHDGSVREPLHRLAPFALDRMFPQRKRGLTYRHKQMSVQRLSSDEEIARLIRRRIGRATWHRWNVLLPKSERSLAREQARYFIVRAKGRREWAAARTDEEK